MYCREMTVKHCDRGLGHLGSQDKGHNLDFSWMCSPYFSRNNTPNMKILLSIYKCIKSNDQVARAHTHALAHLRTHVQTCTERETNTLITLDSGGFSRTISVKFTQHRTYTWKCLSEGREGSYKSHVGRLCTAGPFQSPYRAYEGLLALSP